MYGLESSRHTPCAVCRIVLRPGDPQHQAVAIDGTPADGTRRVPATFRRTPRERSQSKGARLTVAALCPLAMPRLARFTGGMHTDYRGRRATIMGLGHFGGGAAAARWLARQGAIVTVTDLADDAALADSLPLLADVPIAALHLGGHREEDFRDADLVVVNPAVRPDQPVAPRRPPSRRLALHRTRTVHRELPRADHWRDRLERQIDHRGDDRVDLRRGGQSHFRGEGITPGSDVSLAANIGTVSCEAAGRHTFLGGNIGGSLLEQLPQIGPDDWVVLEISSFQLWHVSPLPQKCRTSPW